MKEEGPRVWQRWTERRRAAGLRREGRGATVSWARWLCKGWQQREMEGRSRSRGMLHESEKKRAAALLQQRGARRLQPCVAEARREEKRTLPREGSDAVRLRGGSAEGGVSVKGRGGVKEEEELGQRSSVEEEVQAVAARHGGGGAEEGSSARRPVGAEEAAARRPKVVQRRWLQAALLHCSEQQDGWMRRQGRAVGARGDRESGEAAA